MNKTVTFFAVILSTLLLAGCASTPEQVLITKKEYVFKKPPERLTKDVDVPKPPKVAEYVEMTPREKEEALTTYINALLKAIAVKNENNGLLLEWYDKQEAIYARKN